MPRRSLAASPESKGDFESFLVPPFFKGCAREIGLK